MKQLLHHFTRTARFLLMSVIAFTLCGSAPLMIAWADAADFEMPNHTVVDYSVKVSASDGGVNMRYGPGVDRPVIISMIPNGTILPVTAEAKASNGKSWGFTYYDGCYGWISLTQVKKIVEATEPQLTTDDFTGGTPVNYQVRVSASDGGVNMRYGPGTGYAIKRSMIPNSVILTITSEIASSNGKYWGYTYFENMYGWIALSQTTLVEETTSAFQPGSSSNMPESYASGESRGALGDATEAGISESAAEPEPSDMQSSTAQTSQDTSQTASSALGSTLLIQILVAACAALFVAIIAILVILKKKN